MLPSCLFFLIIMLLEMYIPSPLYVISCRKKDLPFWSVVSRCLLFHSAIYSPVFSSWIIISKKMDMIKYNSVLLCFLLIKSALIDIFLKYVPFLFWSFQTVWQTFPTASWVSVRGAFTNIHVCGSSVMLEQIQWFSAKRKTPPGGDSKIEIVGDDGLSYSLQNIFLETEHHVKVILRIILTHFVISVYLI